MSSGLIPDRPPRKRERPKWPTFLLIAGTTLTIVGFALTFGPLALEDGDTDSPPLDEAADGPDTTDADDGSDKSGDTDASDDSTGTEETNESENDGLRGLLDGLSPRDSNPEKTGDNEAREKCIVK